jgi:hypothetical protein
MAGKKAGLLFFVDIERSRLTCVEPVKETDSAKVRRHVQKVMAAAGAEGLRIDELSVYDRIMPDGYRKICLSHWLKSKYYHAWQLHGELKQQKMNYEADQMRLSPRPAGVPEVISRMGGRFINCRSGILWKVNQLLQHIERTWEQVSTDLNDPTNNASERVIGLTYKIRVKTSRGMKDMDKILNHCYLSEYLRGCDRVCDLRKVV